MPQVNPEILSWARETAGLSPEDAQEAADERRQGRGRHRPAGGIGERGSRAYPGHAVQNGREVPPLPTFYLAQPPHRGDWGKDFRAPIADRSREDKAVLNALVRNVQVRQGLLREAMLDDDEDLAPLPFSRR